MKFSATLLVLVSVGATTLAAFPQISESPSSCLGTDSVLLQTRNFTTSAGDILRVENRACSGARSTNSGHSKRQTVVDACVLDETINFQCFNIPNGVGPNAADCNQLNAAIIETFEAAGDVDLFSVTNNTVAQFSLGTCGYAWINDNPTDTLEFCFSEITGFLGPELINGCIVNGGTVGVATPSGAGIPAGILEWAFEIVGPDP